MADIFHMEFEDEDPSFLTEKQDFREQSPRNFNSPPSIKSSFKSSLKSKSNSNKRVAFDITENSKSDFQENDMLEEEELTEKFSLTHKTSPGGTATSAEKSPSPTLPDIDVNETKGFLIKEPNNTLHLEGSIKRETNYMRSKFRYFNKLNIGTPAPNSSNPFPIHSAPQSNPIPIQLETNNSNFFDPEWNNTVNQTFIPPHELVNRSAFSVWDKQRKRLPKKKDQY
jgi:hypothetical protein